MRMIRNYTTTSQRTQLITMANNRYRHKRTGRIVESGAHPNMDYFAQKDTPNNHHTIHRDFVEGSDEWEKTTDENSREPEMITMNIQLTHGREARLMYPRYISIQDIQLILKSINQIKTI
jgi:hypothetical protein